MRTASTRRPKSRTCSPRCRLPPRTWPWAPARATAPCRCRVASRIGSRRAWRRGSAASGSVTRRPDSARSRVRWPSACSRWAIATNTRRIFCSTRCGTDFASARSMFPRSTDCRAIFVPGVIRGARTLVRAPRGTHRPRSFVTTPSKSDLRILVSNDDGVLAAGIALLADVCATVGQVTVVAPDREQSGTSHSLTLHRPLRAHRRSDGAFQVDGTPTDCVLLALGALMPEGPNWVFSGINHGPNMGEDVLYSGTVSAAMEGLAAGVPSVAISYGSFDIEHLESHRARLERLIQSIVRVKAFPGETLLNITLPPIPGDQVKGVKVTNLGSRVFHEEIATMKDPWGREVFWIGGGRATWAGGAGLGLQGGKGRHNP